MGIHDYEKIILGLLSIVAIASIAGCSKLSDTTESDVESLSS